MRFRERRRVGRAELLQWAWAIGLVGVLVAAALRDPADAQRYTGLGLVGVATALVIMCLRELQPSGALTGYLGLSAFGLLGTALTWGARVDPGWIDEVAPALTLLFGFAAVFGCLMRETNPLIATGVMSAVLILGAASEIIGLRTGLPFGRYVYTDAWRPVVGLPGGGSFPLLLPVAWAMMAGAAYLAVCRALSRFWAPLFAGLLAASVDVLMEPVMVERLGFWKWLDGAWPIGGPLPGGAPFMNFVGWTVVTALAALIIQRARPAGESPEPSLVLLAHAALMAALLALG